jgi:predicted translin family RNA/ssDNA-binding protein
MSQYAEQVELNSWSGGSKLIPLSYEQAQKWVEKHLDADTYEELFGVVEDLSKTTVTLSLPAAIADMLRKEAARSGKTISDVAADAILKTCKEEG